MSASRPALTSLVDSFDLILQARVSIAVAQHFWLALHPANFKFILEIIELFYVLKYALLPPAKYKLLLIFYSSVSSGNL